jgi:hypothetical protein
MTAFAHSAPVYEFESSRWTTVGVGLADRGRRLLGNIPRRRFCMESWLQAFQLAIVCCFLIRLLSL